MTPELRIEVSRRIREEFANGREYYAYHGKALAVMPSDYCSTLCSPSRPFGRREAHRETGNAIGAHVKAEVAMKAKRKLFEELMDGVDAMREQRQGNIMLKTHMVEDLPPLQVDPATIRATRERLCVSRAVFARRLRASTRTLENWEQGRAKPNAQAAALILMVRRYPDTPKRLKALDDRAV